MSYVHPRTKNFRKALNLQIPKKSFPRRFDTLRFACPVNVIPTGESKVARVLPLTGGDAPNQPPVSGIGLARISPPWFLL